MIDVKFIRKQEPETFTMSELPCNCLIGLKDSGCIFIKIEYNRDQCIVFQKPDATPCFLIKETTSDWLSEGPYWVLSYSPEIIVSY
jgi:hypothetical protein